MLEAAARRAVAAWAEAVDGADRDLLDVATPEAAVALLHPGDPSGKTRLVIRGPRVQRLEIAALDPAAQPPTMTVEWRCAAGATSRTATRVRAVGLEAARDDESSSAGRSRCAVPTSARGASSPSAPTCAPDRVPYPRRMERVWAARLRWRLRGAWLAPLVVLLTLLDALLVHYRSLAGDGRTHPFAALLLAGFLNLVAVAALAPLLALALRRARPTCRSSSRAIARASRSCCW